MPSVLQVPQNLENKYLNSAPRANREKINSVIQIYRNNRNVTRKCREDCHGSLPALGVWTRGQERQAGQGGRDMRGIYKQIPRHQHRAKERLTGIKKNYPLRVVLFTQ
ncbi:MAG: hypothetical protein ACKPKO_21105, partial [Candidatus Fonsibacter sp.]